MVYLGIVAKSKNTTLTVDVGTMKLAQMLAGPHHAHITALEEEFGVDIRAESTVFKITGPEKAVQETGLAIKALIATARRGDFDLSDVTSLLSHGAKNEGPMAGISTRKKTITAKSLTQSNYIRAIQEKDLVFGVGPAGTGKTYLAAAYAAAELEAGNIDRIILTRPAIEAGEKLGFLPGDMKEKVDPYLRPIYDALYDMMDPARVEKAIESGAIEIAPLAFIDRKSVV